MDYKIIEWQESQMLEHTKLILKSCESYLIQQVNLDNGKRVYLVPEDFYEEAKRLLQEFNQFNER